MEKELKDNENTDNRGKLIFFVITTIILFLIVFFLLYRVFYNPVVPTGNIDIFDITGKCPTCKYDEENIPGFNVFDDKMMWQSTNELRIFTNPAYVIKNKIAPGATNSYVFRIRNNNDFKVKYTLTYKEENIDRINMKYRLKNKDLYIKGNSETWVNPDELELKNMYLDENSYDEYILEYKWIESKNDTNVGIDDDAIYKINIVITGTEI